MGKVPGVGNRGGGGGGVGAGVGIWKKDVPGVEKTGKAACTGAGAEKTDIPGP